MAAESLLRRPAGELVGRSIWQEFREAVGTAFDREYRRAMQEQVTVQFEDFYEPLARWFEVRAYPSSEGLSVYFHDVTERRRAAEALRESEERFVRSLGQPRQEQIGDIRLRVGSDDGGGEVLVHGSSFGTRGRIPA